MQSEQKNKGIFAEISILLYYLNEKTPIVPLAPRARKNERSGHLCDKNKQQKNLFVLFTEVRGYFCGSECGLPN